MMPIIFDTSLQFYHIAAGKGFLHVPLTSTAFFGKYEGKAEKAGGYN
jgi:hypothetical protein